jgi:biotin transport system permease protein
MISLTSPVKAPWDTWRAGLKLVMLCVATTVLFSVNGIWFHLAAFVGVLGIYAIPGRSYLQNGLRRLMFLWMFLAVIFVWHVATGTAAQGAVIALRMITAVALANLVTMSTKIAEMIDVIQWALTPLRRLGLRTRSFEIAIALVVRFTPVLVQKGGALSDAWRARSPKSPLWRIVLPFTVLAIDDADHVAEALRARGGV